MVDPVVEFPSVVVAGVEIVVDQRRPVAVIIDTDGSVGFATWPTVQVGLVEPLATLLPGPDGAWVHYPPVTVSLMDDSHAAVLSGRDSPAVQVRADGSIAVVGLGDRRAIGATTGVLWSVPEREQMLDETYRGAPMPSDWEEPTHLTLTRSDGTSAEMRVDRYVLAVFESNALVHLVVAPTPPIVVPQNGGFGYDYRISEITLPIGAPFPAQLRFLDHHPDGIGPTVEPPRCWWTEGDHGLPPSPARSIDLTGVAGTQWRRIELTERQITDAVTAASSWFGDPNEFWHGEDGTVGPLATGLHEAEVHIENAWPQARVVVTFRHPHWPDGRLRRSIRIFDDAGRLTANPYVDIHLMEDLETGDLPPVDQAHDGYLDI